jgi:hypothetical protein
LILFLDYDGVLHPDPCSDASRLFEQAPRLEQALSGFGEVALVLSTAWRQGRPYDQLLAPLPPALREMAIGITPNFSNFAPRAELVPYRRQAECVQWLLENHLQDEAWLALDDRPSGFTPYCENLIGCDPRHGLDAAVCARLRSALQRHFQRRTRTVDLLLD